MKRITGQLRVFNRSLHIFSRADVKTTVSRYPRHSMASLRRFSGRDDRLKSEVLFFGFRMVARIAGHVLGGFKRSGKWESQPYYVLLLTIGAPLGLISCFTLMFGRLELVPISDRRHYVWMSEEEEINLAMSAKEELLIKEGSRVLPSTHPSSMLVRAIAKDLLAALPRPEKTVSHVGLSSEDIFDTSFPLDGPGGKIGHFDLENPDITVIESAVVNAFVLPNGAIFVYTGLHGTFVLSVLKSLLSCVFTACVCMQVCWEWRTRQEDWPRFSDMKYPMPLPTTPPRQWVCCRC